MSSFDANILQAFKLPGILKIECIDDNGLNCTYEPMNIYDIHGFKCYVKSIKCNYTYLNEIGDIIDIIKPTVVHELNTSTVSNIFKCLNGIKYNDTNKHALYKFNRFGKEPHYFNEKGYQVSKKNIYDDHESFSEVKILNGDVRSKIHVYVDIARRFEYKTVKDINDSFKIYHFMNPILARRLNILFHNIKINLSEPKKCDCHTKIMLNFDENHLKCRRYKLYNSKKPYISETDYREVSLTKIDDLINIGINNYYELLSLRIKFTKTLKEMLLDEDYDNHEIPMPYIPDDTDSKYLPNLIFEAFEKDLLN